MDFDSLRAGIRKTANVSALRRFVGAAQEMALSIQELNEKTASVKTDLSGLAKESPELISRAVKIAEALGEESLSEYLRGFTPKPIIPDWVGEKVASKESYSEAADLFESMAKSAGYSAPAPPPAPPRPNVVVPVLKKQASIEQQHRVQDAAAAVYMDPVLSKYAEAGDLKTVQVLGSNRMKDPDALVSAIGMGLAEFNKAASHGLSRVHSKMAEHVQTTKGGYNTEDSAEERFEQQHLRANIGAQRIRNISMGLSTLQGE